MTSGFQSPTFQANDEQDFLFASLCDDDWTFPLLDEKETSIISDSLEGQLSEGYSMPLVDTESVNSALIGGGGVSLCSSSDRGSRKAFKRGPESSSAGSSSRGESSSSSSKTSTPSAFTVEIVPQSLTATQLAAVTGGSTVAFNFPSVDIFPAQIGGPWNDGSDDEADDCFDDSVEGNAFSKKRGKKRVRPLNPDADLIAAATEATLRRMGVDPDSKEGKRQKKVIRNRMSAQMHRERKKAYISYLESIVRNREAKIIELQEKTAIVSKENGILRNQLAAGGLGGGGDGAHDNIASSDYSGMTSDDSVSVSSKSSSTSATSHHPKLFKSALSLLSIAMMACFTVYSSPGGHPLSHSPAPVLPIATSSSHSSVIKVLSPGTSLFVGEGIAMDEDEDVSPDRPDVPNSGLMRSRRLLSISAGERSDPFDSKGPVVPYSSLDTSVSTRVISSIFTSTGLDDGRMSISENLLWNKYQPEGNAVQLFPRIPNISVVKKKTHLRTRYNDSDPNPSLSEAARQPTYYSANSHSIRQLDTASRVLVHSGRALLDPSLSGALANFPAGSVANAVSTYVKKDSSNGADAGSEARANAPVLSIGMDASGDNTLFMLLPASQIRWGKSLDDSHSSENIFSGLNYSLSDTQGAFVELGCTVFKAEIIKNVSFQS